MLAWLLVPLATAAPTLTVSGACPGTMTVTVDDATPGGTVALVSGAGPSAPTSIPGGRCAGATTELRAPTLRTTGAVGRAGEVAWRFTLPAAACGQWLEVFDLTDCASSPPIPVVAPDADRDGFRDAALGGDDCDDRDPRINPAAVEVLANGVDDDCDAATDDRPDDDGDGFVTTAAGGDDCDDTDARVNPAVAEVVGNGVDDDCDAATPDTPTCDFIPDPAHAVGEPPALAGITALHNELRFRAGVPPLIWSDDLARMAARWAGQCTLTFEPIASRTNVAGFAWVGQNLAWGFGSGWNALNLAALWGAEAGLCAPFLPFDTSIANQCGHYTQQVWQTTTRVGCAIASCPANGATYLVCDYGPGGNFIGQVPFPEATGECLDQDADGTLQRDDPDDGDATVP